MNTQKPKVEFVLIGICTCKRPKMLAMSLESLSNLNLPENLKVEILIVDNDSESTARETVEEFSKKSKLKINYVVEQERGISNARNKLLNEAINLGATHVAMMDDDEIVDKEWLQKHIELYNNSDAYIISGPTYNKFLKNYPKYVTNNKVFKSSTCKKTGEERKICAGGNVFFALTIVKDNNLYFNTFYKFMGGEDGEFFSKASKLGYKIVWNNEAVNYELVGDSRANLKWVLNRCFYNGYSGTALKFKNNKNKIIKTAYMINKIFVVLLDLFLLVPSIIFGLTVFFNVFGMIIKNIGKIRGIFSIEQVNYYENICGE